MLAGCGNDGNDSLVIIEPGPALSSLSVAGSKTSLNPPYQYGVSRYSVVAGDAATGISITATAAEDLTISINGSMVASGMPYSLDPLAQGETVSITVRSQGGRQDNYELLYLPSDFPELKVDVLDGQGFAWISVFDPERIRVQLRGSNRQLRRARFLQKGRSRGLRFQTSRQW